MGETLETGHISLHDSTLLNRTLISNAYITTFLKKIFASSPRTSLGSGLVGIVVGILPLPWLAGLAKCTVWDLVSPGIIAISLGVAVLCGVFFGVYPAKKAANLDPIESLRYE